LELVRGIGLVRHAFSSVVMYENTSGASVVSIM